MLKLVLKIVGVLLLIVGATVGFMTWKFFSTEEITFDEKCWALLGGGGNSLVLESPEGPLVVDTKFMMPAGKLKDALARHSGKPAKMVINTHYHFDHSGGNPRHAGAEFVAAPTVPERLRSSEPDTFGPGREGEHTIPTTLVPTSRAFLFGGEQVEVHYLGRGHTDGDVVVFLRNRSILHMGDLLVNGFFPVLDVKGGASVREWVGALDKAIALHPAKVIPGHGAVCGVAEIQTSRDYLAALWEAALAAARAHKPLDQLEREFDGSHFGLKAIMPGMGASKNLQAAFDEATAWVAAGH